MQSVPVAVIAILWMTFMIVVVMFPTTPSPISSTMNYTAVVLGGVLILAFAYFYFPVYGGVHWFQGPVRTAPHLAEEEAVKRSDEFRDVNSKELNAGYPLEKGGGAQSSVLQAKE